MTYTYYCTTVPITIHVVSCVLKIKIIITICILKICHRENTAAVNNNYGLNISAHALMSILR